MPSEKTVTKCSETRRSTKPIMEKRRRARINNSLTELKNLILDALKKDNARHSKLEKADILEMTVKHLQNLQMQHHHQTTTVEPSAMAKFRSGFAECANEVSRFFGRAEGGADPVIRQRLLGHLANCLSGMNTPLSTTASPSSPLHVQVNNDSSSTDSRLQQQQQQQQPLLGGVQLVPTRLPSGDIAFLLPAQLSVYAPATVPVSPAPSSSLSSCSGPSLSPLPNVTCGSPVNVLGSSGILSPAASDRCTPSPVSYTKLHDVHSSSQIRYHHSSPMTPPMHSVKMETEPVWRPW